MSYQEEYKKWCENPFFDQKTKEELKQISGGGISATLVNAFIRGVNTFLDVGRSFGSAIRRMI